MKTDKKCLKGQTCLITDGLVLFLLCGTSRRRWWRIRWLQSEI